MRMQEQRRNRKEKLMLHAVCASTAPAFAVLLLLVALPARALDAPMVTATAKGPNQINLTWSAVPNPGYGYAIEIQSGNDPRYSAWTELRRVPYWVTEGHYRDPQDDTASQYPVFSLRNNTVYNFRVRSYSGVASYSTYSNSATATTRNYSIRHVSTSGNDANNGSTEATAWRHVYYAAQQAAAGTVVIIHGGDYGSDYLHPAQGGAPGVDSKVVFIANPGETVTLSSTSGYNNPLRIAVDYVVVDGLRINASYDDNMVYVSGSRNTLANCEFDGSGNVSWGPFISGSHNLVHGVYSHDFGSASNQTGGSTMQIVGSATPADNNIIQYSLLRRGGHDTALNKNNAGYNQWMNNVMDGGWGSGWNLVSDSYASCTYNLLEGNVIKDVAKNYIGDVFKDGIIVAGDYNTVRRNVVYDGNRTGTNSNPAPGIEISRLSGYGAHHNLIYNNVLYHNGGRAIVFMDNASLNDNIIANNIMYYNYGDTTYCPNSLTVHLRGTTTNTRVHHNLVLYKDWGSGIENPAQANMVLYADRCMSMATAQADYGATFYANVTASPGFIDEPNADFHLNSGSHLINAGEAVVDSTWGTVSHAGSAPDIGAYEHWSGGDTLAPAAPTNLTVQ